MSAVVPGCDSDEEVFWGPVTARELEIIWRSRMANKKKGESANPVEKFIKNPEGLNKSPGQNVYHKSSSNSVQEVPHLQDMRNSNENQKGNDNDSSATSFNMSCSDNCFNHCDNIDVECKMGHNSAEPQQADSVDNDDIAQSESVISMSENIESINLTSSEKQLGSIGSKVNTVLDQSNIENIPPEELSINNAGCKEMLTDLVNVPIRKTGDTESGLGHNVLQELNIENQDNSVNSSHVLKMDLIDKVSDDGTNVASESSEETTFVSLNSEEDNCISSSNSQYSSVSENQPEPQVKNKENEEPSSVQSNQDCVKSKIPISNHIKSTCIKPARLQHTPGTINEKWLNDLKRKKIPKPKKPDYMVSPAKLESIMKCRNQPMSPDKPDMKRSAQPKTASSAQPKVASSAPKPVPGNSRTLLTPRKKQFEYVKSPISAYIRTGTAIPTAKSLPALQSPNKIPVPIAVKQTPVQKLPPKFYSSAEKLVIKPGPSASVPKPAENRLFLTPKIFKHQGRVADSKQPGDINVVTPRAVRKTNLTETSFACLPQSSKELEVSVLEEM